MSLYDILGEQNVLYSRPQFQEERPIPCMLSGESMFHWGKALTTTQRKTVLQPEVTMTETSSLHD